MDRRQSLKVGLTGAAVLTAAAQDEVGALFALLGSSPGRLLATGLWPMQQRG